MITITIKTDNAAFEDGNRTDEIARILREIADDISSGHTPVVNDLNGNKVGSVMLTGKDRG